MNKTKKITQGAMLLAILGALIIIDRLISFFIAELVVLIVPVIIIMYSGMYEVKDGLLLSVGILIIGFIFTNFYSIYLIYIPAGILTGIAYAIAFKKGCNSKVLLLVAIGTYVFAELVSSFIVSPLMGFPIASMIEESKVSIEEMTKVYGMDIFKAIEQVGVSINTLLVVIFAITSIVLGLIEGLLIHLLSIFLLKRFKIANIGVFNILEIRENKPLAYICMACMFSGVLGNYINNEIFSYASIVLSLIASLVLMYYGYIFITIYGAVVLRRKGLGSLVAILMFVFPVLIFGLVIVGFLYASGPLRRLIDERINQQV